MAGNPLDFYGAPLFDIYNDQLAPPTFPTANNFQQQNLPTGGCNFVDLSPGANGAKCGCRRFWIRSAAGSPTVDGGGWCMCNHHACFHDESGRDTPGPGAVAETRGPGQENERPRTTGREPLSPMVDMMGQMPPPPTHGTDVMNFPVDNLSFINGGVYQPQDPRTQQINHPPSSLPDTLPWDEPVMSHSNMNKGPLGSYAFSPSQATSTTSSVRAKYLRPFEIGRAHV